MQEDETTYGLDRLSQEKFSQLNAKIEDLSIDVKMVLKIFQSNQKFIHKRKRLFFIVSILSGCIAYVWLSVISLTQWNLIHLVLLSLFLLASVIAGGLSYSFLPTLVNLVSGRALAENLRVELKSLQFDLKYDDQVSFRYLYRDYRRLLYQSELIKEKVDWWSD